MEKKGILISIKPRWCYEIFTGHKTAEIRTTKPAKIKPPFEVTVYCTMQDPKSWWHAGAQGFSKDDLYRMPDGTLKHGCSIELMAEDNFGKDNFLNGKIIGTFTCTGIYPVAYTMDGLADKVDCDTSLLKPSDFIAYGKGRRLWSWKIENPILRKHPIPPDNPPQSWIYYTEVPEDGRQND